MPTAMPMLLLTSTVGKPTGRRVGSVSYTHLAGLAVLFADLPQLTDDDGPHLGGAAEDGLHLLDGLAQRHVGGGVEDVEIARRQHQREGLDAEFVRQQFGMAGPFVAGGVHGLSLIHI